MNSNDFLCTRIAQISEAVIREDWQRAHELINEWEADDRLSSIVIDDWYETGVQFEDLNQCLS